MNNYVNNNFSDSYLISLFKFLENKNIKNFYLSENRMSFLFELDHQDNMNYSFSSNAESVKSKMISVENLDNLINSKIITIKPVKEELSVDENSNFTATLSLMIKTDKGNCIIEFKSENLTSDLVELEILKTTTNIKVPSHFTKITQDFNNNQENNVGLKM